MKKSLTTNDIAELLSTTKEAVRRRAEKEGWPFRSYTVCGGKRHNLENLPEDVRAACAAGCGEGGTAG